MRNARSLEERTYKAEDLQKRRMQADAAAANAHELELAAHALQSAAAWFNSTPSRELFAPTAADEIIEMADELLRQAAAKRATP